MEEDFSQLVFAIIIYSIDFFSSSSSSSHVIHTTFLELPTHLLPPPSSLKLSSWSSTGMPALSRGHMSPLNAIQPSQLHFRPKLARILTIPKLSVICGLLFRRAYCLPDRFFHD